MSRAGALGLLGLVVAVAGLGVASLPEPEPGDMVARTPPHLPEGRVRVEVVNVGGVDGMAREATTVLREAGADVVGIGNAQRYDSARPSSVVDRVGDEATARAVAELLGIDNVLSDPDPNLYVDVSVWLGSAWTPPGAGGDATTPSGRAWWNPRTWMTR